MTNETAEGLREEIRQTIDDQVLLWTGRSVGDLKSGHVADALLPVVEAECRRRAAEELLWAATLVECRTDLDMLKARADAIEARS